MTTDLNFKGNSQSRLSKKTLWFRYLAEINLILGAWYLYWRIFHSLDLQALWLAVPLLLAEIYSYVGGAMLSPYPILIPRYQSQNGRASIF
jgi:cellulose synthase (UDP-forming)